VFLWALLNTRGSLPGLADIPPAGLFTLHYTSVWLATFFMLFGPMGILFHQ
jgi:hypothetical protein